MIPSAEKDAQRAAAAERAGAASLRTLRGALACARALLDELDLLLSSGPADAAARGVVLQTADELVRIAGALKWWVTSAGEQPAERRGILIADATPGRGEGLEDPSWRNDPGGIHAERPRSS